jgi:starch phosphorylase
LEEHIIPEFHQRNEAGIPTKWVARIRESMSHLAPEYSATRAVRQYTEEQYIPAAAAYAARMDQRGKLVGEILAWQKELARNWNGVSFGAIKVGSAQESDEPQAGVSLVAWTISVDSGVCATTN